MTEIGVLLGLLALGVAVEFKWPGSAVVALIAVAPFYDLVRRVAGEGSTLLLFKEALLLIALASALRKRSGASGRVPTAVLVYFVVSFFGVFAATSFNAGMLGFRATCQWLVLAVVVTLLADRTLASRACWVLALTSAVVAAVYAVEKTFFPAPYLLASQLKITAENVSLYEDWLVRYSLVFGNGNCVALYCAMGAICAAAMVPAARSAGRRILLGGLAVMGACGIVYTASRGAVIAAVVGLGWLAWQRRELRKPAVVLVAIGALSAAFIGPYLGDRFAALGDSGAVTGSYRWEVYRDSVLRALSGVRLLLIGSGLGTYGGYVSYEQGISDVITENQYLKVLGEQGIVGLISFLAALTAVFHGGRAEAARGAWNCWAMGVRAAAIAVSVYCLFGNMLDGMFVSVPFFALVGCCWVERWVCAGPEGGGRSHQEEPCTAAWPPGTVNCLEGPMPDASGTPGT